MSSNELVSRLMTVLNAEADIKQVEKIGALADCLVQLLVLCFSDDPALMRQLIEALKQRLIERVVEAEGVGSGYLN